MADSPDEEVELIFVRDDSDEQLYNNTECMSIYATFRFA